MKKSLSLLLVLALILGIFALVGCSGDDDENANAVSVAVIVSTTFGDLSFNDSAKAGGEALRADLDLDVEYIECNGENYKQQMMQAADTHDIVVPVGWEFYEITEAAKEYPDTKFIWVDNVRTCSASHTHRTKARSLQAMRQRACRQPESSVQSRAMTRQRSRTF